MRTLNDLQQAALRFFDLANESDSAADVLLVRDAINRANSSRATETEWKFMQSQLQTLTLVTGQTTYILPQPDIHKFQYLYSTTNKRFLNSLPIKQVPYVDLDYRQNNDSARFYSIDPNGSPVKAQPTTASVLSLASSASETNNPSLFIEGEDSSGNRITETVEAAASTSQSFAKVHYAAKTADFNGTITLTAGATTLLTLAADEYAKSYAVIEFHTLPTATETLIYRYFRKPRLMTRNFDTPNIPYPHSEILVYDALLDLATYNELDSESVNIWREKQMQLKENLYLQLLEPDTVAGIGLYTNPGL